MTIYRVDSAVSGGTGDGSSWANAYSTFAAALTAITEASGDEFWISHAHTETPAAALTSNLNASGANRGIRVKSVNKANDTATFGATFVMAANAISLYGLIEDIHFDNSGSANDLTIQPGNFVEFAGCKFSKQAVQRFVIGGGSATRGVIRDSEFACGTSYTVGFVSSASVSDWEFHRNTISGTKGTNATLFLQGGSAHVMRLFWQGSDLSGWDNILDHVAGSANGAFDITLSGCAIPASLEIDDTLGDAISRKGGKVTLVNCAAGTVTTPIIGRGYYSHYGKAVMQSAKYRTGGASDGTTRMALEFTALSGRTWDRSRHAVTAPIPVGWVAAGTAVTITAYVAHDGVGAGTAGALTNAQFALRIYGPSNAGSATGTQYSAGTMAARNATPTDLTTDSVSAWTGSLLGTKQKVALTYTPTIAGPVFGEIVFCPGVAADKVVLVDAVATLS